MGVRPGGRRLRRTRLSNESRGTATPGALGDLEYRLADVFGMPLDTDITAAILGTVNNKGKGTRLRLAHTALPALQLRSEQSEEEVRLSVAQSGSDPVLIISNNLATDDGPNWSLVSGLRLTSTVGYWAPRTGRVDSYFHWHHSYTQDADEEQASAFALAAAGTTVQWPPGAYSWSSANGYPRLVPPADGVYLVTAIAIHAADATTEVAVEYFRYPGPGNFAASKYDGWLINQGFSSVSGTYKTTTSLSVPFRHDTKLAGSGFDIQTLHQPHNDLSVELHILVYPMPYPP